MARSDVDQRVSAALKALIAPREDSVRALASALDAVETHDAKIDALLREREQLLVKASDALDSARSAGWKAKELTDAGLVLPRAYAAPTAKNGAKATAAHEPATPAEQHNS